MLSKEELILKDILNSINNIEKFLENETFENFIKNDMLKSAVLYNLIILGEASRNLVKLNEDFSNNELITFLRKNRNKITHKYWISQDERQWDLIKNEFPQIKEEIENKIKELKKK